MNTVTTLALELFVQGQSAQSAEAMEAVRWACETQLRIPYTLDVIDVHRHPERVGGGTILATPTLLRREPEPMLRLTGRLTRERVLEALRPGTGDA